MKKIMAAVFILLAVFFSTKGIIIYSISSTDYSCSVMDLNEEESSDKNEKGDTNEKDDIEVWQHFLSERLDFVRCEVEFIFQQPLEKKHFRPYFEVFSPPPEFI